MSQIGRMIAEMKIIMPGEQVIIWLAQDGRGHVGGSRPLSDTKWYMDVLRGAREGVSKGRAPQGWLLMCKGAEGKVARNPLYLKMLQAARDIVRHAEQQSYRTEDPNPNDVLKGIGSPYRVHSN